jgi:hypothetical protein
MEDVSAADTMLFEDGGRWWMLTNIDKSNIGDHCSELYVFFSDSPLSREWTPHPANPIYIDAAIARNGGLIHDRGSRFRVAQRQGFDAYGKGFSIMQIEKLTPTEYRERCVAAIEPNFKRGLNGTHHMSTTGNATVIDHACNAMVR